MFDTNMNMTLFHNVMNDLIILMTKPSVP